MTLSTHVLDTMNGCPAAHMKCALYNSTPPQLSDMNNSQYQLLKEFTLNHDGRNPDGLLLESDDTKIGFYRLAFDVADYFKEKDIILPTPNFINIVCIDFAIYDSTVHYHVPLLVSPWSYSTYRGS